MSAHVVYGCKHRAIPSLYRDSFLAKEHALWPVLRQVTPTNYTAGPLEVIAQILPFQIFTLCFVVCFLTPDNSSGWNNLNIIWWLHGLPLATCILQSTVLFLKFTKPVGELNLQVCLPFSSLLLFHLDNLSARRNNL